MVDPAQVSPSFLQNGDFELGYISPWGQTYSTGSLYGSQGIVRVDGTDNTGSYAYLASPVLPSGFMVSSGIYQSIETVAGQTYSVKYSVQCGNKYGQLDIYVNLGSGIAGLTGLTCGSQPASMLGVWQNIDGGSFQATSTTTVLNLAASIAGSNSIGHQAQVFMDNVVVTAN